LKLQNLVLTKKESSKPKKQLKPYRLSLLLPLAVFSESPPRPSPPVLSHLSASPARLRPTLHPRSSFPRLLLSRILGSEESCESETNSGGEET
ncbi:unnamed protein product, partial [Brassica oleracea]